MTHGDGHEDGLVWIEGRTSDLIVRGSNKVFPEQIEEEMLLLPGIREAAVAGVPDERLGEVPVAFVVGDATDDELKAVCRENLVPYKIPVAFERMTTPSHAARSARCSAASSPSAGIVRRPPEGSAARFVADPFPAAPRTASAPIAAIRLASVLFRSSEAETRCRRSPRFV